MFKEFALVDMAVNPIEKQIQSIAIQSQWFMQNLKRFID